MTFRNLALPLPPRALLFVAPLMLLSGAGCARVIFDLRAACCVNPPSGKCNQDCSDARIIQLRVYQLKREADPCQLRWEDFLKGIEADSLKGLLSDAQVPPLVQNVDRNEWRTLPALDLHKDTTHLLIVTVGRAAGPKSIRQFELGLIRRHRVELYFNKYDVCIDKSCDNEPREEGQCQ